MILFFSNQPNLFRAQKILMMSHFYWDNMRQTMARFWQTQLPFTWAGRQPLKKKFYENNAQSTFWVRLPYCHPQVTQNLTRVTQLSICRGKHFSVNRYSLLRFQCIDRKQAAQQSKMSNQNEAKLPVSNQNTGRLSTIGFLARSRSVMQGPESKRFWWEWLILTFAKVQGKLGWN